MPFVSKEKLDNLQRTNEALRGELTELQKLKPSMDLALMLRDEMVRLMGDDGAPGMSPQEIGELAYNNVLEAKMAEARSDLVARYEQDHRRDLYQQVVEDLDSQEGDTISDDVRVKVETDPKLALELRQSARKELAARALGVVRTEITEEQQEVVNAEAERQISLDRLDVKFALERELDLVSDEVQELLEVGDNLEIFYKGDKARNNPVIFQWVKDANKNEGWIVKKVGDNIAQGDPSWEEWSSYRPNTNLFVTIGVINKNLETGKAVIQPNRLAIGLPLVIIPVTGKQIEPKVGQRKSSGQIIRATPLIVDGTDFQTKNLVFTRSDERGL